MNKFHCDLCDYHCKSIFLLNQHFMTQKHLKKEGMVSLETYTCDCGREYKHIQSYNRHLKKCKRRDIDLKKDDLKEMISTLITQNQNILLENREMREMVVDLIPKVGNNVTINNKFNLNLFLNEDCKNALNLSEFINKMNLKLSDLDETRENGYISGITNIFVRELKRLDMHKRPIHCSDLKREIMYVKDNDCWERDDENKKIIRGAINTVTKKQINIIKEGERNNPDWEKTEEGTNNYMQLVSNITSTGDYKSDNRIIKSIAKEVVIDK